MTRKDLSARLTRMGERENCGLFVPPAIRAGLSQARQALPLKFSGWQHCQQMRGNCSPESMSTTRDPPTRVFMVTIPGCFSTTSPMIADSFPSG